MDCRIFWRPAHGRRDCAQRRWVQALPPRCALAASPQVLAPPAGGDSESLLALPAMQQVSGQRVLVFRGVGGRELLADTLRARGARGRVRGVLSAGPARGRPRAAARTPAPRRAGRGYRSEREALANLLEFAGAELAPQLVALPVFVTHVNIGEAAQRLGFRRVRVTPTSDEGLLQGMMAFFAAPA